MATDEESREVEETSLPEEAVQSDERLIITQAVESLRQKYPEMFKPTSRCKLPHLNIDVLRDDLFSSGLLSNHKITSPAQLEDILERINKSLEAKYLAMVSTPKKRKALSKSTLNAISKATSQNFFLGMDKEWLFTSSPEDKA